MQGFGLPTTPQVFKPPQELVSESLTRTYLAWRELAGSRFAPSRKEITPSRFKAVLGEIFLVDVIDGGTDFRLALGGDTLIRFLNGQLSAGMLLSTISGSLFHDRVVRIFQHCINTKEPVAAGPSRTTLDGREFMFIEALVLPLSDTSRSVTSLLGAVHRSMPQSDGQPSEGSDSHAMAFGPADTPV